MTKVLIALDDKAMADVIATACRQFETLEPFEVPRNRLFELLDEDKRQATIIHFNYTREGCGEFASNIRKMDAEIHILCLLDKDHRDRHNRLKIELGIFSFIPLPVDPFELAKRLQRLETHYAPPLMPVQNSVDNSFGDNNSPVS
ncbi:MAG: hypothetical protein V3W41_18545 [Planctomycetota bacterium]